MFFSGKKRDSSVAPIQTISLKEDSRMFFSCGINGKNQLSRIAFCICLNDEIYRNEFSSVLNENDMKFFSFIKDRQGMMTKTGENPIEDEVKK